MVSTPNGTTSDALVAADLAHVLWAVNLGCLGFHVWPNRVPHLEVADELRIDLDPSPGVGFPECTGADLAHDLLAELGIATYVKTSARGLHIYAALEPRWDSYEVRAAAVALARELERRRPDLITAAWWKEERGQRVFVDFNQNAPHKTVFGAWCVRPRVGAQVSTPITWDEVATVQPDELTIATVPARVAERGNPWAGMYDRPQGPHAAARALAARLGQRSHGCALAARLPEAARRAAAGRAQPGPHNLTRGSRSAVLVRLTAGHQPIQGEQ